MANDFEAFGSAIYSAISGAGTAQGVNLHYALAPQGGTPPYAIFQRINAVDEYTFNTRIVETEYMVKVIGNHAWPTSIYSTYNLFDAALQDKALTITGYTRLFCRRISTIEYQDNEGFWHVGGMFRIAAQKT